MAVNYFKKIGARRLLIMIMGNVFLGMGISIFKLSGLGNDPFSGMVMALANIPHRITSAWVFSCLMCRQSDTYRCRQRDLNPHAVTRNRF